ncbi:MAG: right-handed parallel beta-helix repeat-containing protein, partial [Candidatus Berkelbacteria bacterium]|nr:right-handed parallel beta-helix repeat-containing protein [Candidatus Berkelbacteria bacterium]
FVASSDNNIFINNTLTSNIGGFYLADSSSNILTGNTISSSFYGISQTSVDHNNISSNTISLNTYGIFSLDSSSNNIENNHFNSNTYGVTMYHESEISASTVSGNEFSRNANAVFFYGVENLDINTSSGNRFVDNNTSVTLDFDEAVADGRAKDVGDSIDFALSMFNIDGSSCTDCVASLVLSPQESSLLWQQEENQIVGSFTASRTGTYSLTVTATDSRNNATQRNFLFFISTNGSETTKYYLRGAYPVHGQPAWIDSRALLLSPPSGIEEWTCTIWVQSSPDELPDYPLSYLTAIDVGGWYKSGANAGIFAIRFGHYAYGDTIDSGGQDLLATSKYKWADKNFTDLNWSLDYPQAWYWLELALGGEAGDGGNPYWTTFPVQGDADSVSWAAHPGEPSYADFTYQYTTTPAIKTISNPEINVLSATAPVADSSSASIVLDGTGSTSLVLDNYKRPFLGYTTTISSDGTTTLAATNLTGEVTINSINMDIIPNTGSVDVNVTTWNTGVGGDYSKKWTEEGTGATSALHTIGDLKPNTKYVVKVDGNRYQTLISDSAGKITFTYDRGYSTKTFEVGEDVSTLPIVGLESQGHASIFLILIGIAIWVSRVRKRELEGLPGERN